MTVIHLHAAAVLTLVVVTTARGQDNLRIQDRQLQVTGSNTVNGTGYGNHVEIRKKKKCKQQRKCKKQGGKCVKKGTCKGNVSPKACKKGCNCCLTSKPVWCNSDTKDTQQRIVNGNQIKDPRKYPWQVGLKDTKDEKYYCGGSFISDKIILTAAHCFYVYPEYPEDDDCYEEIPDKFYIGIGDYNRNKAPISNVVVYEDNVIIHRSFECLSQRNDIALIKFPKKPTSEVYFHPICFPPQRDDLYEGRTATVIGWGGLKGYNAPSLPDGVEQTFPHVLQEAQVTIMRNKYCKLQIGDLITDFKICTANNEIMKDNKAACTGDSGGPLFVINNEGKRVIVGIVSFASDCASEFNPNVFTRVSKYVPWVNNNSN